MGDQKIETLDALKNLQDGFYQAIFDARTETIKQTVSTIIATEALSPADRIHIYRGSILGGITAALTNIYPVCVKLVGEAYFTHMVSAYLKKYPSNSADLGRYGEHLPAYIAEFKPAEALPYFSDVAQLELFWHKAFNAAEDSFSEQSLRPLSALQGLTEEQHSMMEFCLSSSVHLCTSSYPVHRIWHVNQDDYQEAYEGEGRVNLNEGGIKLLIWRGDDFSMRVDVLSDDEYQFIAALLQGKRFEDIVEMSFSQPVSDILQRCIQMGLIVGFKLV